MKDVWPGRCSAIASVATMTDSVIVRLEKVSIVRVIHQEPAFSEMFIAHLVGRGIRVEADHVDQLFNSSEKRLARLLLLLANGIASSNVSAPSSWQVSKSMPIPRVRTFRH